MTELDIKKALTLIKKRFPKQISTNHFEYSNKESEGKRTCILHRKGKDIFLLIHNSHVPKTEEIEAFGLLQDGYQQMIFAPQKLSDLKAILNSLGR
ncbi:hypothetical protein WAF17_22585 (plasmid) [Bernardetia sp. ABR2-2B]|uniref:hypothetical protein n=1 Tax=Bernardetia sp. ABR2-2B TaxID=3127472 RepID=UPI0030CFC82D